jgi:G3E family GTPase
MLRMNREQGAGSLTRTTSLQLFPPDSSSRRSLLGLHESDHTARFATRIFRCATPIAQTKLHEALDQLPRGVLRLKGFVRFDSSPQRLRLVQGVGTRWTISDAGPDIEQQGSALVVIGAKEVLADADFSKIRQLFNEPQG